MLNVLITAVISFAITVLAIPAIIKVADEKNLFDIPDKRKLHTRPIASLGGIGIFIGFFLSSLLCISFKDTPEFKFFLASAMVIFFLGLKDDILILSPRKKFVGQLVAAAIIIHFGNIQIESMHGFLGIYHLPFAVSIFLTYLIIIVTINAFNLIDGVDGLAGSLGVLTMAVFGTYFYNAGMTSYTFFAFSMAGSLIAFLFFNNSPAKIFMGDSGSLLLGLINGILVIKFISTADAPASPLPIDASAAIGFAILSVPLLDTLRVFSLRIAAGKSPFSPDRNHIHHLLLDRGLNHKMVTITCLGLNISLLGITWFGRSLGSTILLFSMTFLSVAFVVALNYFIKPVGKVLNPSFQASIENNTPQGRKIIALKTEQAIKEAIAE